MATVFATPIRDHGHEIGGDNHARPAAVGLFPMAVKAKSTKKLPARIPAEGPEIQNMMMMVELTSMGTRKAFQSHVHVGRRSFKVIASMLQGDGSTAPHRRKTENRMQVIGMIHPELRGWPPE